MKDEEFLNLMRKRFTLAKDAARIHNERAEDDLLMLTDLRGWDDETRKLREAEGKPCLTFNALPTFVRQVTAQIRGINPAIKVTQADNEATKEVAEIMEGLIRHIENQSDASSVYEQAAESAASCSMGYWRIRTKYCNPMTFHQEAIIERIYNPFSVFFDPSAKHPTRMDGQYCFVIEEIPVDDFKEQYPDIPVSEFTGDHKMQRAVDWFSGDTATVAEYFWIEREAITISLMPGGVVVEGKQVGAIATRKTSKPVCKWAKVTMNAIIEGPVEFPSEYIPVIAVTGEEFHLGEQTFRSSVTRFAKDAMRLYNYSRSSQAELIAMQPKAPYMVTTAQIQGLENIWAEANTANRPYLVYNPDPEAGAPQRVQPPVSSSALTLEAQIASDDMKRTTGIYDASLGARSNETSGVAIERRQQESQSNTSVYADNMVKGVMHTGRILVDMIPRVYDAKRAVTILGEDGQDKMVTINDMMVQDGQGMPVNDTRRGSYGVRISVGPSYSTRREAGRDSMMQFLAAVPVAQELTADLVAKMQDWPEAERVAERLRKALPPGVAEESEEEPTPEMMQQAQMQQAQQAQQQAMQQAAMELEMRKATAEASKAEAEAIEAQADAKIKEVELSRLIHDEGQRILTPQGVVI